MVTRELFHYTAVVQGDDGNTREITVDTYWGPNKENSIDLVAGSAAAMATVLGPRGDNGVPLVRYVPITAQQVAA